LKSSYLTSQDSSLRRAKKILKIWTYVNFFFKIGHTFKIYPANAPLKRAWLVFANLSKIGNRVLMIVFGSKIYAIYSIYLQDDI